MMLKQFLPATKIKYPNATYEEATDQTDAVIDLNGWGIQDVGDGYFMPYRAETDGVLFYEPRLGFPAAYGCLLCEIVDAA